jgi:hypothetical protein
MRWPVVHSTIFVLVVHLVIGCCVHHEHTCEANYCQRPGALAERCQGQSHRHADEQRQDVADRAAHANPHADHPGDDSEHTPPRHDLPHHAPPLHHCQGDQCQVVRSERSFEVWDGAPRDIGLWEPLVVTPPLWPSGGAAEGDRDLRDEGGSAPRFYLLYRVLLI